MGTKFKLFLMWVRLTGMALGALIVLLASTLDPFDFVFFLKMVVFGSLVIWISGPKKAIRMADVYLRYKKISDLA